MSVKGPPAAKPPLLDGYLSRAVWGLDQQTVSDSAKLLESFGASWRVPDPPETNTSRAVLLFIGLQSSSSNAAKLILQAVLQWEEDSDRKRHEWSVASYFVYGTRPVGNFLAMTKPVHIEPGRLVEAKITLKANGNGMFGYQSEFIGIPGSELYIESPIPLVEAGVALEVSEVMQLTDLPSSDLTRFERIEVLLNDGRKASPIWEITNLALDQNVQATAVAHNGQQDEIDISYR